MSNNTTIGVTVEIPRTLQPVVCIPRDIAEKWMMYGTIAVNKYKSEWGCAVRGIPSENGKVIQVTDFKPYKIKANGGYWENIPGERQKHFEQILSDGLEDQVPQWNGLFHTHPVGSNATMSGTDVSQLKELAEPNWFGFSIIAPATKDYSVVPEKWLVHYADARSFGGETWIVKNSKPYIQTANLEAVEAIEEEMKDLMVQTRPTNSNNFEPVFVKCDTCGAERLAQFPSYSNDGTWICMEAKCHGRCRPVKDDEPLTEEKVAEQMLLEFFDNGLPDLGDISVGDWVEVIALGEGRHAKVLKNYKNSFCRVKMVDKKTGDLKVGNDLWLNPLYHGDEMDKHLDIVVLTADKGSEEAKQLNSISRNGVITHAQITGHEDAMKIAYGDPNKSEEMEVV